MDDGTKPDDAATRSSAPSKNQPLRAVVLLAPVGVFRRDGLTLGVDAVPFVTRGDRVLWCVEIALHRGPKGSVRIRIDARNVHHLRRALDAFEALVDRTENSPRATLAATPTTKDLAP